MPRTDDALQRLLDHRSTLLGGGLQKKTLIVSLVLHLAGVLGFLFGPALFGQRERPQRHTVVELTPLPTLRPKPASPPPQTEDVPEPAPEEPEPEPPPPPPKEEVVEKKAEEPPPDIPEDIPVLEQEEPKKIEAPKPKPQRAPPPPPKRIQAPVRNDPPPPSRIVGNDDVPAAILGYDDVDFTFSYYTTRMLAAIRPHWRRPAVAEEIETVLHFRIASDGTVSDLEIRTSSGVRSFDIAATRAVTKASPLPPLPRSYGKPSLGVTLVVR